MITGIVNVDYEDEAVIRLRVQGPTGQERELEASRKAGMS
jgi:hypothetical protein